MRAVRKVFREAPSCQPLFGLEFDPRPALRARIGRAKGWTGPTGPLYVRTAILGILAVAHLYGCAGGEVIREAERAEGRQVMAHIARHLNSDRS